MSRRIRWALGLFLFGVSFELNSSSWIHSQTGPRSVPTPAPSPAQPPARPEEAWARFNSTNGGKWSVEWNETTGTPRRISGSSLEVGETISEKNVETVGRMIVERYRDLLKADPRAL